MTSSFRGVRGGRGNGEIRLGRAECGVYAAGDHGVKALGDGWLMTVTLIAGENLAPTEACAYSNPYVVFTCNGRRRTSSVKLRNLNPLWRGTSSLQ